MDSSPFVPVKEKVRALQRPSVSKWNESFFFKEKSHTLFGWTSASNDGTVSWNTHRNAPTNKIHLILCQRSFVKLGWFDMKQISSMNISQQILFESGYLYFCLLQKVQERLRVAAHVSMERSLSLISKHLWHIAVTEPTVCMSLVIYQYYFIAFHRIVQNKSVCSFFFQKVIQRFVSGRTSPGRHVPFIYVHLQCLV